LSMVLQREVILQSSAVNRYLPFTLPHINPCYRGFPSARTVR
jgi:hypothetical protein